MMSGPEALLKITAVDSSAASSSRPPAGHLSPNRDARIRLSPVLASSSSLADYWYRRPAMWMECDSGALLNAWRKYSAQDGSTVSRAVPWCREARRSCRPALLSYSAARPLCLAAPLSCLAAPQWYWAARRSCSLVASSAAYSESLLGRVAASAVMVTVRMVEMEVATDALSTACPASAESACPDFVGSARPQ